MIKKILTFWLMSIIPFAWSFVNANNNLQYHYFYGQGCGHCIKVENYFDATDIDEKNQVQKYEIWFDNTGRSILEEKIKKLPLTLEEVGTPFLIIQEGEHYDYLMGDAPIINYFKKLEEQKSISTTASWASEPQGRINKLVDPSSLWATTSEENNLTWDALITPEDTQNTTGDDTQTGQNTVGTEQDWKIAEHPATFIPILLSGALSDSINPCAFAVMLLLLATILSKSKSKKKTIYAGLLFCLAIFLSYSLMGLGFLKLLYATTMKAATGFKWGVWIFGILLWLANLKDFFWYWKGFVMEVPLAWRPKMMKIIQAVVSPWGAFFVGVIVSLFLLPCSAGPYVTVLGMLSTASTTNSLTQLAILYVILYNIVFVLPMLVITIMVGNGYTSAEQIGKFKNKHTRLIHLIVGLLMLALWVYIISSLYL